MWKSRAKHPVPDRDGVYVVARFSEIGEMVDWNINYAYCKDRGGWMPNTIGAGYIIFTHWMPYGEYRAIMASVKREGED